MTERCPRVKQFLSATKFWQKFFCWKRHHSVHLVATTVTADFLQIFKIDFA
jgi:hypothetical protein